jgi:hypothetical protein
MKKNPNITSGIVAAVIFFVTAFINIPSAQARSLAPAEGASFNVSGSIIDNLKTYLGKDVVIYLRSGKYFQGRVKAIGDHLIHVEKIAGKDFYDALISNEDITAIEAKFREMK